MTEDEAQTLLAENAALRAQVAELQTALAAAQQLLSHLQDHVATLEQLKTPLPSFVKPNLPRSAPKPPRRKRAARHNHGRPRATPTEIRTIAFDTCPECGYGLQGQSIARRREVIDLPPPPPPQVIEYQVLKRYCPHCARWREPELRLDGLVLGHGRISVRIMVLVGWLRTTLRLPIRQIQAYFAQVHQLSLSAGEIVELLHGLAAAGKAEAESFKAAIRGSPVVHEDETSWREGGRSGYVWVATSPDGTVYFHYEASRAGAVSRALIGAHYRGTLYTDFYAGYNEHTCVHQRCWAHLLRDLAKLVESAPGQEEVVKWAGAVVDLYRRGRTLAEQEPAASQGAREALYAELVGAVHSLGLRWAREREHVGHALCQRLLRHERELFQYVRQAGVEATNNRAERAVRPLAVARKISGGTRSAEGSTTRMRLQTLFGTWVGRGLDPIAEGLKMLGADIPLPSS